MDKKNIHIIFMGTSDFAVPVLNRLAKSYLIDLVVTTPDKPAGRKKELRPSPVKIAALKLGLSLEQPETLRKNDSFVEVLAGYNPSVIVVAAYGKILPAEILNLPEHGCLNIHPSLLPQYRGATPMQSTLINGDTDSGVSIILMDKGMDTGDIVAQSKSHVDSHDYYDDLSERYSEQAAAMIDGIIPEYIAGKINLEIQDDSKATYTYHFIPDSGKLRWIQSATSLVNRVRGLSSTEGTYCMYDKKRLNIYKATVCELDKRDNDAQPGEVTMCPGTKNICINCGKGRLHLEEIQIEGGKRMSAKAFINGHQDFIGTILK